MYIFLVQHGEAVPEQTNPERPLSENGNTQVHRAAELLKKLSFYPELILHSGKQRARETAEIISTVLGGIKMESRSYLNPGDEPERLIEEIRNAKHTLLIAGHMPFLSKLVSRLLFPDGGAQVIDITNASPLILMFTEHGWRLDTYIKNDYIS